MRFKGETDVNGNKTDPENVYHIRSVGDPGVGDCVDNWQMGSWSYCFMVYFYFLQRQHSLIKIKKTNLICASKWETERGTTRSVPHSGDELNDSRQSLIDRN